MSDAVQLTTEEIQQFREQLKDNPTALQDIDLIERCDGDLEYTAIRLARRANIDSVRANEEDFWQQAIKQARQLVCREDIRKDIAPNILGGLYGLFVASSNPILSAVPTPFAIHVVKTRLENFCD